MCMSIGRGKGVAMDVTIKKTLEIEIEVDGVHSPQEGSRSPHSNHFAPSETIIEDIRCNGVSLDFEMWNTLGIDEGELQEEIAEEYISQLEYKAEAHAEYLAEMRRMAKWENEQR